MNILLVDDHALIREALAGVLRDALAEASLLEAKDCQSALSIAEAQDDIQLAVLDINLPDGDGLDLWDQLRKRHPGLTAVILSANNTRDLVLQTLDRGAAGFIPKSSDRAVMLQAFRLVLAGGVYIPPEALAKRAEVSVPAAPPRPSETLGLTARQLEVLSLMMQGKSNKWICRRLDLAEPTVKHHVTAILKALDVTNRTEAVVAVSRLGLVLPDVIDRRRCGVGLAERTRHDRAKSHRHDRLAQERHGLPRSSLGGDATGVSAHDDHWRSRKASLGALQSPNCIDSVGFEGR